MEKVSNRDLKKIFSTYAKQNGYEEIPPTIIDFINDDYYLGQSFKDSLFPFWKRKLVEIYPTPFPEHNRKKLIIMDSATGTGKSTAAMIMFLYDLARLLCLEDPQGHYRLQKSAKIVGVLMNSTKEAVEQVNYDPMISLIRRSPFFVSKFNNNTKSSLFIKNIDITTTTRKRGLVGLNAITFLIDEIARYDSIQKGLAKELVTEALNRVNSRFLLGGDRWPSCPSIISSADTDGSIIADLMKMAKGGELGIDPEKIQRIQAARYEVKAGVTDYSGETFRVFLGNMTAEPFIVKTAEDMEMAEKLASQPNEIKDVPIEHLSEFSIDIYSGIRDVMGISISADRSFFYSKDMLRQVMDVTSFNTDVIELPNGADLIDMFNTKSLDILSPGAQRVIGMDIALNGDRFGLAMGHIHKFKENGNEKEYELMIDFAVGIIPSAEQKIKLSDIRKFIYDLHDRGVSIDLVVSDGFQSTDMLQTLNDNDYKAVQHSVDLKKDSYYEFRNYVMEEKIFMPFNSILFRELINLRENPKKVDHPEWNPDGTKGSKDISDAVVQVVWGLLNKMEFNPVNGKDFVEDMKRGLEKYDEMVEPNEIAQLFQRNNDEDALKSIDKFF